MSEVGAAVEEGRSEQHRPIVAEPGPRVKPLRLTGPGRILYPPPMIANWPTRLARQGRGVILACPAPAGPALAALALGALLTACKPETAPIGDTGDGGTVEVVGASYSLDVTLIPPLNDMSLFSDVASLHVWFELEDGTKVEVGTFNALSEGAAATDLPAVAGATLILQGTDAGGAPILVGRAGPFDLSEDKIETHMIIGRIGQMNWLPTLPEPRAGGALVADGQGGFLLMGGSSNNPRSYESGSDEVWRLNFLNPTADATWEPAGTLPARTGSSSELGHVGITANLVAGSSALAGKVLVIGGAPTWTDGDDGATDQIIVWDPASDSGASLSDGADEVKMRGKRFFHVAVEDARGRLIVGGGWIPTTRGFSLEVRDTVEVIDPSVPSQELVAGAAASGLAMHAGARDALENVVFCGGAQSGPAVRESDGELCGTGDTDCVIINVVVNDACDVINAAGDLLDGIPLPSGGLVHHQLTALPDEQVLLTGGLPATDTVFDGTSDVAVIGFADAAPPRDEAWLWDGAAWTAAPVLGAARALHAAVPLPDGTVLLVGGVSTNIGPYPTGDDALACAEIYDPLLGATPLSPCDASDPSGDLEAASAMPMTAVDPEIGVVIVGGLGRDRSAVDAVGWYPFPAE